MSIALDPKTPAQPAPPPEPYPYGWREIVTRNADGSIKVTRIPLTLDDALHPQLGDVMPETSLHAAIRKYLANVFEARLAGIASALVLSDVIIIWDVPDLRNHAPDISVIFGVQKRKEEWTSFNVAEEKARPRLIVEIVSPNTRENDVNSKLAQYHRAGVQWYIILDRVSQGEPWQLRGFEYTQTKYREMPKDKQGRLWLEPLGIWIGTRDQQIVCYDGDSNKELGEYTTIMQALEAAEARAEAEQARAEAEKQRAEAAEARLREIEAELARLRGQNPGGAKEIE